MSGKFGIDRLGGLRGIDRLGGLRGIDHSGGLLGIDRSGGLHGIDHSGGLRVIACEGAPRDLGVDQGTACAEAIRARVERSGGVGVWLGRFRPFEAGALERARRTARDVRRHFPHLDERVIGIARGAKVPEIALAHMLARELGPDGEVAALRAGIDARGRIVVQVPPVGILRQARPDHGFASVEWTLPWLPGALAGANRAGLAGAVVSPGSEGELGCAAPAFLLLQNCLAQFETAANAAEWCERRPAGGRAQLLFADAAGGRAAVSIEGEKRTRLEPAAAAFAAQGAGAVRLVLDPAARSLEGESGEERLRLEP